MDVSWVMSFLLGLPVAVLAILKIIGWSKKHQAGNLTAHDEEQSGGDDIIKEEVTSSEPADQAIAPIIRQGEMAAEIDRVIAKELRQYEAEHHRGGPREEIGHRIS